jgi:hypothetical protein
MPWWASVFDANSGDVRSIPWSKPIVVALASSQAIVSSIKLVFGLRLVQRELRLLAVAITLLLRNLWALCQWMTLARSAPGRPTGESSFRFRTLLRWISRMIETRLALQTTIELPTPSTTSFLLQLVPVADY